MTVETMTEEEVRREGMDAVKERLGMIGAIRFLQQFNEPGHDYTKERAAWADALTQEEIVAEIKQMRRGEEPALR